MARSGPGWCPFATQVEGVTTFSDAALLPVGFCDHAAGGFLTTMASASFWNGQGVSTHFAVGRKGEIIQMVNIFQTAFAQGRLGPVVTWPHWRELGSPNPNTLFISAEHEDYELVSGKARAIPGSEWTQAEYDADLKLKRWCVEESRTKAGLDVLKYGIDSLAGHYMFDGVNRAECPGRYWRTEYRQRLFTDLTASGNNVPLPPPTVPTEEVMQVHNSISTQFQGATGGAVIAADAFDAPPPPSKMLRVELYLKDTSPPGSWDGALQVFHADGKYAGQVGWDGARYGCVDVVLPLSLKGDGILAQLGVVGYWP